MKVTIDIPKDWEVAKWAKEDGKTIAKYCRYCVWRDVAFRSHSGAPTLSDEKKWIKQLKNENKC